MTKPERRFVRLTKTGDRSPTKRRSGSPVCIFDKDRGTSCWRLTRTLPTSSFSAEQKGQITLFAGIWLEDQGRFDDAIVRYRQVAKVGEPASQRAEGTVARWLGLLPYGALS